MFEGRLVPQKSLASVRTLLGAVATHAGADQLRRAPSLERRHFGYARAAAISLGALTPDGALTPGARRALASAPGSPAERDAYRQLLVESELFRVLVPDLLDDPPPSRAELSERIHRLTGLGLVTANRRAGDLLGWRQTLKPRTERGTRNPQLHLGIQRLVLGNSMVRRLHETNPWWSGRAMRPVQPIERSFVRHARRRMFEGGAPIVVIKGPRQVGKSVAQEQLIARLLDDGVDPTSILRIQFDDLPVLRGLSKEPILDIVNWYEETILLRSLNQAARDGRQVYVFVDEAQNVRNWSVQLKFLVDLSAVKVVLTGSSALRIAASADSLAGRTTTIEVHPLSLVEIARFRGLGELPALLENGPTRLRERAAWESLVELGEKHSLVRDKAAQLYLERGGYPRCHVASEDSWETVAERLDEDILQKAIKHDARIGPLGSGRLRDASLLDEVFREACRYAGGAPSHESMARDLNAPDHGGRKPAQVRDYLDWFERALLLRQIRPHKRLKGQRKLCIVDPGLRSACLRDSLGLSPEFLHDAAQETATEAGHVIESIVGAWLGRLQGTSLEWVPTHKRQAEIDFLLTIGNRRIPIEVKYRRQLRVSDTDALGSFLANPAHRADFGVIITQAPVRSPHPSVVVVPLASLFLLGA